MKIDIPEEWLVELTGCHPDTPVKEAIEALRRMATDTRPFFSIVGEYAIHQIMVNNYEKS